MAENFETILQKVNQFVRLDKKDREIYTKDFDIIKTFLIGEMKELDSAFQMLFHCSTLGGSYADNLKVSKPDEFDLVLEIKLPFRKKAIVKSVPRRPGYVKINIENILKEARTQRQYNETVRQLERMIDSDGFLKQKELHAWFESLITRVIKGNAIYKDYHLSYRKCGPAHTLEVEIAEREFSIDFVPAFVFEALEHWVAARACPDWATNKKWIAIAKSDPFSDREEVAFMSSYVDIERDYIDRQNNLKNTLRIMKKLRDRQSLTNLKSYYIKSVYLLVKVSGYNFNQPTATVFCHMLNQLIDYVVQENLPFFWNQDFNMFKKFNSLQISDIRLKLLACKRALTDSDPKRIYSIFLTQQELSKLERRTVPIPSNLNSGAPRPTDTAGSVSTLSQQSQNENSSNLERIVLGVGAFVLAANVIRSLFNAFNHNNQENRDEED